MLPVERDFEGFMAEKPQRMLVALWRAEPSTQDLIKNAMKCAFMAGMQAAQARCDAAGHNHTKN